MGRFGGYLSPFGYSRGSLRPSWGRMQGGRPSTGGYGQLQVVGRNGQLQGKVYSRGGKISAPMTNSRAANVLRGNQAIRSARSRAVQRVGRVINRAGRDMTGLRGTAHRFAGHIASSRSDAAWLGGTAAVAGGLAIYGARGQRNGPARVSNRQIKSMYRAHLRRSNRQTGRQKSKALRMNKTTKNGKVKLTRQGRREFKREARAWHNKELKRHGVQKKPSWARRHIRVRRDAKGRFAGSY